MITITNRTLTTKQKSKMKNHLKFRTAAIKQLEKIGAVKYAGLPFSGYRLEAEKINFTFFEDNGSGIYSVFGKFDDPRPDLGNPFSGKYNFHSGAGVNQSINQFIKHLQIISK